MTDARDTSELTSVIDRALAALTYVAESGRFNPKDLAHDIGVPISTVYRLLQALAEANYVEKTGHGSYQVGRQFMRVAALIVDQFDYVAIAESHLRALRDRFHETCAFAIYLPKDHAFSIVHTLAALHPLQYVVEKNRPRSMVWGALGRAMLPYLSRDEQIAAIERQGAPYEPGHERVTIEELEPEFERTRSAGCFVATSPNALGTNGTAAPVFDARGAMIGSVGVTVPAVRYDSAIQPELSKAVIEAASGVSTALGFDAGARRRRARG